MINQNAELPFTSIITPETVRADDYSIINLTYPESGNIDFGVTSHAEGMSTCAINMYAHSEGYTTEAYGQYSHAEGRETEASYAAHAEGRKTKAFGAISHAEGNSTVAEGYCAHVEGQGSGDMQNRLGQNNSPLPYIGASGEKSHAEGTRTNATGHSSHAEGFETFATGNRAHSEGYFTQANASDSHAEGNSTIAQGTYSHAEGVGTNASGSAAHAEGQGTGAMQNRIGENNTALPYLGATGDKSHTEGTRTSATMNSAHAEGFETFATANRSHAEGGYTQAKGIDSHAEGYSTIATNQREHAEGQFNVSNLKNTTFGNAGNTIHSVGIGTNADNRKNAIEIMQNGDIYMYGIGEYDGTNINDASTLKQVIDSKSTFSGSYTDLTNLPEVDLTPMLNSSNLVTSNGVYSKIHNLSLEFSPSNSALLFKSDNSILSTVGVSDFSISGILNSALLSNDILTLNFSSGDNVTINLVDVLFDVLTEYKNRVQTLQNRHTALSETAYELLAEKDPDTFYYIYEE